MAAKITKLTDNSWIVRGGHKKIGVICKIQDGYNFFPTEGTKRNFSDYEKLEKYFGKLKIESEKEVSTDNINGYPLKHSDINIISEDELTYSKIGSEIVFKAGYFGIRHKGGWVVTFCPKEATLSGYETIGPFRSKVECTVEVQHKNTET